jgi:formylglycine-generating enzyme required for sulfatase activity
MRSLLLCGVLSTVVGHLPSQATGRTMQVLAPAVMGQTARFGMNYPPSAVGNPYTVLWSMPPFAGTVPLTLPGFTVQGLLRVAPASFLSSYAGVLPSVPVSHSLAIPDHPSFVGMAWDLQSVDLSVGSATVWLADNDLSLVVADAPPPHLDMVWIPAGTFSMGSSVLVVGMPPYYHAWNEQPLHQVTLRWPFWIGRCEVTQAQYLAVMGTNPSLFQGPLYPNSARQPVEMVSWNDAVAYCAALTASERAAGRVPAGYEYRLPTEAEWEYCCRAGTTTEFHHGAALLCGQANVLRSHTGTYCFIDQTAPVGGYAANAWGLHDMHGNVAEWCLDAWDHSVNYSYWPVVDPFVQVGAVRIVRGGDYHSAAAFCRSASRAGSIPTSVYRVIGFRVVCAPLRP